MQLLCAHPSGRRFELLWLHLSAGGSKLKWHSGRTAAESMAQNLRTQTQCAGKCSASCVPNPTKAAEASKYNPTPFSPKPRTPMSHMAVSQNPVPLVNISTNAKWMFIHPKWSHRFCPTSHISEHAVGLAPDHLWHAQLSGLSGEHRTCCGWHSRKLRVVAASYTCIAGLRDTYLYIYTYIHIIYTFVLPFMKQLHSHHACLPATPACHPATFSSCFFAG